MPWKSNHQKWDTFRFAIDLIRLTVIFGIHDQNMLKIRCIWYPCMIYVLMMDTDMTCQWNSGYVSGMFCFVTYQYHLKISLKTEPMANSVVSILYLRLFDDVCYRYYHYSTQNRLSVYSSVLQCVIFKLCMWQGVE